MAFYRKKPVVIEAIQFDGSQESIIQILDMRGKDSREIYCSDSNDGTLIIKTLEGDMKANQYDWIIKGVNGEFYPCKPDIFEKTYEQVASKHDSGKQFFIR